MEVWNNGFYDQLFLIDKLTGRGAKIKLKLDMFGKTTNLKLRYYKTDSYGFSLLFAPLQLADIPSKKGEQKRIAGKIMDPDSLQDANSWVLISNWK